MTSENTRPQGWQDVLAGAEPIVALVARRAREVVNEAVPDAAEDVDVSARMLGFTFAPGTYKGLFAGLVLHTRHVNLMFSEGVALLPLDSAGLLTGTGKLARHIKLRTVPEVEDPHLAALLLAAAARRRAQLDHP
ncbi:hypothetical protein ACF09C_10515 [Streptomyces sp. NPDC014870]|uniref:hypothetical protein n=1 Tax=Streptomyces sp. NPDC014870 TaxID=3364925 RepID=UPI003703439A